MQTSFGRYSGSIFEVMLEPQPNFVPDWIESVTYVLDEDLARIERQMNN